MSASLGNFGALAWVSLAGNPLCPHPEAARTAMPTLAADAFSWGKALGDGASGDVFAATMVRSQNLLLCGLHVYIDHAFEGPY